MWNDMKVSGFEEQRCRLKIWRKRKERVVHGTGGKEEGHLCAEGLTFLFLWILDELFSGNAPSRLFCEALVKSELRRDDEVEGCGARQSEFLFNISEYEHADEGGRVGRLG